MIYNIIFMGLPPPWTGRRGWWLLTASEGQVGNRQSTSFECSVLHVSCTCVAVCCKRYSWQILRERRLYMKWKYMHWGRGLWAVCLDTVCCSVLQCVTVCCSLSQCVAVCRSLLQCVAVCCSQYMLEQRSLRRILHHDSCIASRFMHCNSIWHACRPHLVRNIPCAAVTLCVNDDWDMIKVANKNMDPKNSWMKKANSLYDYIESMIIDLINFAKDPHKNHRTLCHWCKISSNVILSLVHSLTLSMNWTYFAKDPHQSQKTLSSNDVKFRVTSLWVWFIPWPYPWSGLILSDNHIVDRWLENWWTSRMRSGVMWAWQSGFALQVTSCCLPWRKGCLQGSRV